MSYESKIYIVEINRHGKKILYAETLATMNLSCMGHNNGWQELFTKEIDYKLFMDDVGLLCRACGMDVVKGILSDRLGVNYGSVYENAVAQKAPKAEILVMSVFPFGKKPGDWHRPKLRILNPLLAERMKAYPYVKYLDVHDKFLDENGVYRPELSRGDNVHPSVEGYKIWAAALLPEFKRIIGRF